MGTYNHDEAERRAGYIRDGQYGGSSVYGESSVYGGLRNVLSLFEDVENIRKSLAEKEQKLNQALANLDPQTRELLNSLVAKIDQGEKTR